MSEPLLKLKDAAAWFKVHPKTVEQWANRPVNALKRMKVGRVIRFRKIDLIKFQERNTR